jgi:hypothetical protein
MRWDRGGMGRYGMGKDGVWYTYIIIYIYALWLFNIAMENDPFIDGLPIENGDVPWLC